MGPASVDSFHGTHNGLNVKVLLVTVWKAWDLIHADGRVPTSPIIKLTVGPSCTSTGPAHGATGGTALWKERFRFHFVQPPTDLVVIITAVDGATGRLIGSAQLDAAAVPDLVRCPTVAVPLYYEGILVGTLEVGLEADFASVPRSSSGALSQDFVPLKRGSASARSRSFSPSGNESSMGNLAHRAERPNSPRARSVSPPADRRKSWTPTPGDRRPLWEPRREKQAAPPSPPAPVRLTPEERSRAFERLTSRTKKPAPPPSQAASVQQLPVSTRRHQSWEDRQQTVDRLLAPRRTFPDSSIYEATQRPNTPRMALEDIENTVNRLYVPRSGVVRDIYDEKRQFDQLIRNPAPSRPTVVLTAPHARSTTPVPRDASLLSDSSGTGTAAKKLSERRRALAFERLYTAQPHPRPQAETSSFVSSPKRISKARTKEMIERLTEPPKRPIPDPPPPPKHLSKQVQHRLLAPRPAPKEPHVPSAMLEHENRKLSYDEMERITERLHRQVPQRYKTATTAAAKPGGAKRSPKQDSDSDSSSDDSD